jgi:hypothetical protein
MDPSQLLTELIDKSLSGLVYDIAAIVHHLYKNKYVCAKIKSRQWFVYDGLKWCYTEIGPYHDLSTDVVAIYERRLAAEAEKAAGFETAGDTAPLNKEQANEWEICKKRVGRFEHIISKLKNVAFKESVCREAMYLFYNPEFLGKLDKERHLVCFRNGVLDMRSKEFRGGRLMDYQSLYIDDDYMSPVTAAETGFQIKVEKFMTFREGVIAKRKGSQFKFVIGDDS